METELLSVREIKEEDIPLITDYWLNSDKDFLTGMGVDVLKIPDRNQWQTMLKGQLLQPYREKKSFCLIWEASGIAVGHSNVNPIDFGKEAHMHLHLWNAQNRKRGYGSSFVKLSLPFYFNLLQLHTLYCSPYALNPAPNKTLQKAGFELIKTEVCIPGSVNFEQEVNRWMMKEATYRQQL